MNKKNDIKLNFKPEIFFIDLDGTALDLPRKKERISQQNLDVISQINKKIPVVISTGRINSPFVVDLMKKINSPFAICQNGGLIIDNNNNTLAKHPIPSEELEGVVDILKEEKMFIMFNSASTVYGKLSRIN